MIWDPEVELLLARYRAVDERSLVVTCGLEDVVSNEADTTRLDEEQVTTLLTFAFSVDPLVRWMWSATGTMTLASLMTRALIALLLGRGLTLAWIVVSGTIHRSRQDRQPEAF